MTVARFYQFLFGCFFFLAVLAAEFYACGLFYRFARPSDLLFVYIGSFLLGFGLVYWLLRPVMRSALREQIPRPVVVGFFLVIGLLAGFFFRFSFQLLNGVLDFSPSQTRVYSVTDKRISALGGSLREGLNPMAHLVRLQDPDDPSAAYEVLLPPEDYYFLNGGSPLQVSLRSGLFHLPWVEDFEMVEPKPSSN